LFNTILASNIHVIENDFGRFAVNDDCKGTLDQLSYSLLTTTTGCDFTPDSSITGENPKLEVLADNGGLTQTHALKADSPAIDAGDPEGCKDHEGEDLTSDQRGEPRPFDGDQDGTAVCDIGAYEYLLYQDLTLDKAGTGNGRVTSSPAGVDCGETCSASLLQGSLVTLAADPADGSSFTGWSGACTGTGDCQLTLDTAKTVTATFEVDQQLTVTLSGVGDGRVTSSPAGIDCGQACSADFPQDTQVTLTADPDEGSSFGGWSGACSGMSDCQLTLDAAKTVTAIFEVDQQLTVTLAGVGDGRVTSSPAGIDCGTDCSAVFAQASLVTLTADPEDGSSFSGWSGACSGKDDCQVNMNAEKSVTVTFNVLTDPTLKLFLPMSLR
jgi:hypothetical protein